LHPDETRHIQVTLRLQPGSPIRVTDGRGHEASAVITAFEPDQRTRLTLRAMLPSAFAGNEHKTVLRLFAAFAAKGVMDELVEKGQELGLAAFYPLVTERTVVSLAGEKEGKVLERWYKIARESAKQSGNTELMQIAKPMKLEAALKLIPSGEEVLIFHPGDDGTAMAGWLRDVRAHPRPDLAFNLFIGPEGGFSEHEIEATRQLCESLGIRMTLISLGRAILRVSTAVVAAVGAIKYSH
ncbi:MAG: 16S rRNA (uracil(1498)-N(3))-methyltransferase, partial [Candidatus Omnitrophica bacterium]|nr:16S rRNA (uracil(1498)-N(3))-methyltransferase [Candidatus Omnitrophota bacterium]